MTRDEAIEALEEMLAETPDTEANLKRHYVIESYILNSIPTPTVEVVVEDEDGYAVSVQINGETFASYSGSSWANPLEPAQTRAARYHAALGVEVQP